MNQCNQPPANPCCTPQPRCGSRTPTSTMFYDGPDIPNICVRNGDPLNFVIGQIGKAFNSAYAQNAPIWREEFVGVSNIVLSKTPQQIIGVILCGCELHPVSYKVTGRTVVIDENICAEDATPVSVIYTSKYQPSFNSVCNG